MNISTKSLRDLKDLTSGLKSSNILPIYDYLRFDKGTITKMTAGGFFVFKCPEVDQTMLVDEKLLYVKLANSSSEFINISQKGKKVTLTNGTIPTSFQVPDIEEWPAMPDYGQGDHVVSTGFHSALKKAINFPASSEEIPSIRSFVMVGKGNMGASDAFVLFCEPIDDSFELVIERKQAEALTVIPVLKVGYGENWQFFFTFKGVYGFTKSEIGFTDFTKYTLPDNAKLEFSALKSDFLSFNNECIGSSKDMPWVTIMKGKLSMNDIGCDIQIESPLDYLTPSSPFTYNPAIMNRLLKSFKTDELDFYSGKAWYWIKSQAEGHSTLIMKLEDQPNEST